MEQESLKPSKSRKKSYEGEGDMFARLKYPVDALSTIVYKFGATCCNQQYNVCMTYITRKYTQTIITVHPFFISITFIGSQNSWENFGRWNRGMSMSFFALCNGVLWRILNKLS